MEQNASLETMRVKHAMLDALIKEEESYIWKNLAKIETLKRSKLQKKDEILKASSLF